MTKKEWLRRAQWLNVRLNAKLEKVEWLRDMAGRATGSTTALRLGGTSNNSKVERYVCEMIDYENRVKRDISQLCRQLGEIQDAIDEVENEQFKALLELRYVNFKKWDEISEAMGYDIDAKGVHKIHGRALQNINVPQIGHCFTP